MTYWTAFYCLQTAASTEKQKGFSINCAKGRILGPLRKLLAQKIMGVPRCYTPISGQNKYLHLQSYALHLAAPAPRKLL